MPRIVFHHINKCAGTSLLKYLQNFFPSDECIHLEEHYSEMNSGDVELEPNRLARARFIHDPFGSWYWPEKISNVATMCFLRDPLDRVVSNWWMVHRWTDDEVAVIPGGELIRDLARNDQVAFFSHPQSQYINWNQITCQLACAPGEYRQAWRNGSPIIRTSGLSFGNGRRKRCARCLLSASRRILDGRYPRCNYGYRSLQTSHSRSIYTPVNSKSRA
ncbi:hypothetical protein HAT93_02152 [Dickeya solani]|nr:hypothetical protein [Dickeya solani]